MRTKLYRLVARQAGRSFVSQRACRHYARLDEGRECLQEEFYGKEVIVADREMVEMVSHVPELRSAESAAPRRCAIC